MVPREKKNNAYAKFWGTNKEYYGIFRTGLLMRWITVKFGFCLSRGSITYLGFQQDHGIVKQKVHCIFALDFFWKIGAKNALERTFFAVTFKTILKNEQVQGLVDSTLILQQAKFDHTALIVQFLI